MNDIKDLKPDEVEYVSGAGGSKREPPAPAPALNAYIGKKKYW
jgi:hypothetical protein